MSHLLHHHSNSIRSSVRMTEGAIGSRLIRFAAPLFIGNLFQQLYSTADALIVGNLLGNNALAAVSSVSSLIFMLIGFVGGGRPETAFGFRPYGPGLLFRCRGNPDCRGNSIF